MLEAVQDRRALKISHLQTSLGITQNWIILLANSVSCVFLFALEVHNYEIKM